MIFHSIGDVMDSNRRAGHHWFEPKSMRFFKTRVSSKLWGGRYFITSEQGPTGDSPRLFSVREVLDDATIKTVGTFQGYKKRSLAETAIRRLLAEKTQ